MSHDDLLYRLLASCAADRTASHADRAAPSVVGWWSRVSGPFVGPVAAMGVDRYFLIMVEEARSPNTLFRPITDEAIFPTFVSCIGTALGRNFERSGAFNEAVPSLLGAASRPVTVSFVARACYR